MGSIIGEQIKISLFGESHGEYIGATIDGLPSGIKIDFDFLYSQMEKRKSIDNISTLRREKDDVKIISGLFRGYTTGTPLTILIKNDFFDDSEYERLKNIARPGQVDYVSELKYHGYQDYRGGGHFSGRLTAPLVAIGSIALAILKNKGIIIGTYIHTLHNIKDKIISNILLDEVNKWNNEIFPTIDNDIKNKMLKEIELAKENNDSVGGITETIVMINNKNIILGEPYFNSLESKISNYLFSIGGIKGIEFGLGFEFAKYFGSEIKDEWEIKNKEIHSIHNYNGGINGGISNLEPIVFRCVFKPTSSIKKPQKSVNFKLKEEIEFTLNGFHDPAIIHRAIVVINSLTALALIDLMAFRYGNEWLK